MCLTNMFFDCKSALSKKATTLAKEFYNPKSLLNALTWLGLKGLNRNMMSHIEL